MLRAGAQGLPVVLVQPTLPLGPGDRAPTPTGKTILDFLNGRIPGWFDTALNVVDVDDVATGHLLAAERGAQGRSYVLGGENLELRQILDVLAAGTGLPRATHQGPPPGRACLRRTPRTSSKAASCTGSRAFRSKGARMATTRMIFSDARARRELGYRSRPAVEAIMRSARWYAENGYVSEKRLARISWKDVAELPPSGHIPEGRAGTATGPVPEGLRLMFPRFARGPAGIRARSPARGGAASWQLAVFGCSSVVLPAAAARTKLATSRPRRSRPPRRPRRPRRRHDDHDLTTTRRRPRRFRCRLPGRRSSGLG